MKCIYLPTYINHYRGVRRYLLINLELYSVSSSSVNWVSGASAKFITLGVINILLGNTNGLHNVGESFLVSNQSFKNVSSIWVLLGFAYFKVFHIE